MMIRFKKVESTALVSILVTSIMVFVPLNLSEVAHAAPVGNCNVHGSVAENANNGFYTVKFELTSTANTNGNNATCTYTVPTGVTQVEFLSVSGGGGGGRDGGGGGGGGGVLYYKNWNVTPGAIINLTVGAGGAPAGTSCVSGDCPEGGTGNTSVFDNQSTEGGGGGGGRYSNGVSSQGSGGGAGHDSDGSVTRAGGNSTGDSDIYYVTYGNDGGANSDSYGGGGGGSASNTGTNTGGVGNAAGAGGNGFYSNIEGVGAYYGGGGGGGTFTTGARQSGGLGGGGTGGNSTNAGADGTNGTGGGGGGGGEASRNPGRGGGGVIIVRFQNACSSTTSTYSTGIGSNTKNLVRLSASNSASSCTGNWTVPANVTSVEVFVLGGGGGGGGKLGAGGGSGGAINDISYSVTAGGSVSFTVGGGGRGGYGQWNGSASSGSNSIFGNLTAYGGGAGGDEYDSGVNGGSGGGAGGGGGSTASVGTATQAAGTGTKYGSNGGAKSTTANAYGSGGGGGLAGAGGSGSSTTGGAGGTGISIYGYSVGGGGGGGVNTTSGAGAATQGGGAGGNNITGNEWGSAASAASGGGGGGGANNANVFGGDGGSGVIIILYATNLTLTFNSNYGTPTTSTQTIPSNTSTNLTANSFTRVGYTFANWTTQANGSGTSYTNSAAISISTATTLYAQWSPNTLTITYNTQGGSTIGNGSTTTGGSILASPGSPTKAGYSFLGWATASYGTLITFPYTHSQTANFTLYAQWAANSLTITYDTQGGSTIPNGAVLTGSYINPAPATPTRDGYTFNGWFVAPTGGTAISNFSTYTHNQTSNFTLYAQWTAQVPTLNSVTVTGSAFGGSVITATPSVSGVGTITYTYQWYRIMPAVGLSQISGATSSTYTLTDSDLLGYVYVSVIARNESGSSSAVIGSMPSTPKIGVATPTISGYLQRGQLLTGATSSTIPAGASVAYQWQRSDTESGSYTSISGATSSTYTLTSSDVGKFIKLSITISNSSQGVASNPSISNATNVIIDSYTITYAAGGGSGSGPTSPASVINGATFTIPANTFNRAGYSFTGWSDGTNTYQSGDTYPAAAGNISLTATWSANTLNITYDANGGTTPAGGSATTTTGSTISTLASTTRSGYTFNGWFTSSSGGSQITTSAAHNQTSSFTLYAQWSANSLTITYDSQEGSVISSGSTTTGGSIASSPGTPTRAGYTFNGWFLATSGGSAIDFPYVHSQNASFTLYAQWSANALNITYDANGGTTPAGGSATTTTGSTISTLASTTRSGYTFNGWFTSSSGGSQITTSAAHNQTSSFTLYAQWSPITLNITYDANGGGSPAGGSATTTTGGTITSLPTTTRAGYTFNGWFTSSTGGTQITTSSAHNQSANFTLYAQWIGESLTPIIDDVLATIDGFTVSQKNYDANFTYSFTLTNGGLATMNLENGLITVTNLSVGTSSTITITTNRQNFSSGSATATGNPIPFRTVTFDANGGTGTMNPQLARNSTALSPNTFTKQYYEFAGWNLYSDGSGITTYSDSQIFIFSSDITLYAVWNPITINVTFNSQGGTVVATGTTTYSGKIVSAPTQPTRTGYNFLGWFTSPSGGNAIIFEYIHSQTADFTLYAQWSPITLNITYNANGGTTPAGGSATTTTGGTITSLPTTTRAGYTFNGWFTSSTGGTQITTSSAHNQSANFTLYAQWSSTSTDNVITFTSIANQSYGATLDLSGYVSASSGLTVSLSSATTAVCTISTTTVTAISVGTCTITAAQSGNDSYIAANNVSRSFTVGKKALSITIGNLSATVGGSVSDPSYSQSGLVTSLGDSIAAPTYHYQGSAGTFYPNSTTKPTALGTYRILINSISLSSGSVSNYEISITSGVLSITGVSSNQLSGISIKRSSGDKSTELLTGFNDATTSYTIYLEADISAVTATITRPAGSLITAQIKVNSSGWRRLSFASNTSNSGNLPIPVATNTISILTTATDQSNRTFTITIFRDTKSVPSGASSATPTPTVTPTPATQAVSAVKFYVNNATGITSGAAEVALNPVFSTNTLSYTASFTNKQSATIMQINFTAAGVNLRLKVNNGPFRVISALGSSNTIALNVGSNTALLRVFSTDGTTVDYTFTLTRAAATP